MKHCSRCGGTGKVSRGLVVNGTCFKCGGDGRHRPSVYASRHSHQIIQYALIDARGVHLAINTDRTVLDSLRATMPQAVDIVEF
jgi:hypothetical protein